MAVWLTNLLGWGRRRPLPALLVLGAGAYVLADWQGWLGAPPPVKPRPLNF